MELRCPQRGWLTLLAHLAIMHKWARRGRRTSGNPSWTRDLQVATVWLAKRTVHTVRGFIQTALRTPQRLFHLPIPNRSLKGMATHADTPR